MRPTLNKNQQYRRRVLKRIISRQPRFALGVQVALAVFAHGKASAATAATTANTAPLATGAVKSLPMGAGKFIKREIAPFWSIGSQKFDDASNFWDAMVSYAEDSTPAPRPLSYEEARLWLQSYNAGPYAVLRYKGTVPYRETRNYVPRVLKY